MHLLFRVLTTLIIQKIVLLLSRDVCSPMMKVHDAYKHDNFISFTHEVFVQWEKTCPPKEKQGKEKYFQ